MTKKSFYLTIVTLMLIGSGLCHLRHNRNLQHSCHCQPISDKSDKKLCDKGCDNIGICNVMKNDCNWTGEVIDEETIKNEGHQHSHECYHDVIQNDLEKNKVEHKQVHELLKDNKRRQLQQMQKYDANTAQPIRIKAVFAGVDNAVGVTEDEKRYIKEDIIKVAVEYFQKRIKVNRRTSPISVTALTCKNSYANLYIPQDHIDNGVSDADYVVYVGLVSDSSASWAGLGGNCVSDYATNRRPIAGLMIYNIAYLGYKYLSTSPKSYQMDLDLTLHEISHGLVFSSWLYNNYLDENGYVRGQSNVVKDVYINNMLTQGIATPTVVQVAKEHYGCSSITAVPIENDGSSGSAGSHWERTHLYNEYMTGQLMHGQLFTKFTAALMRDSGWYGVDLQDTQEFFWGKNDGCEFFNKVCKSTQNFHEFCNIQGQGGCTANHQGKGACYQNMFTVKEDCMYIMPYSNGDCRADGQTQTHLLEKRGSNSKCVNSKIVQKNYSPLGSFQQVCFDSQCVGNTIVFKLTSNYNITCTSEGEQTISNSDFHGTIYCPNPNDFCDFPQLCKNHCSQKGVCHNGQCECAQGWTGEDCSIQGDQQTCHFSCQTCSGPANSQCLSCQQTFLKNGYCVSDCGQKYYQSNNVCQQCYSTCLTCSGSSSNQCLTCEQNFNLKNNQCVSDCGINYYKDNGFCKNCHSSCQTCSGAFSNQCLSCDQTSFLKGSQCVLDCGLNYFKNYQSRTCDSCHSSCLTCSGSSITNCLSCDTGKNLFLDSYGKCVSDCGMNHFKDIQTQRCQQCHESCNNGCVNANPCTIVCHSSCLTCNGEASNNCLSCKANTYLKNNMCVANCGEGYFSNSQQLKCEQCFSTCKTCSGTQNNQCLTCEFSYHFKSGECVSDCGSGFFKNQDTYQCEQCHSTCTHCIDASPCNTQECHASCKTCSGSLENQCNSCHAGTFLKNFMCVDNCGVGFYKDKINHTCEQCNSACRTCRDGSANNCRSCNAGFFYFRRQCLNSCPQMYYQDTVKKRCRRCKFKRIGNFDFKCKKKYCCGSSNEVFDHCKDNSLGTQLCQWHCPGANFQACSA